MGFGVNARSVISGEERHMIKDRAVYQLRSNIIIKLCADGFIRVFKKNSESEMLMEALYAISRTQGIILLFFRKPTMVGDVVAVVAELYDITVIEAEKIAEEIIKRFSGILEVFSDGELLTDDKDDSIIPVEIRELLISEVHRPNELRSSFVRPNIPKSVVVFISDACMCNCVYCRVDSGICNQTPQFIDLKTVEKLAQECKKLQIRDIELTGGDPLIHPHFIEILEIFRKNGVPTSFSTKCPIDKEKLSKIMENGVELLQISLDSVEKGIFAYLTGTSDLYLEKLIETIRMAISLKMKIRIKSVITKINIDKFESMIKSLYEIGVTDFVLQQLSCGEREFSAELGGSTSCEK